jgi:hypothetical protein
MADENPQTGVLSKRVRRVSAALVVGVVGSALWEIILKPIVVGIGNALLETVGFIWSGYLDTLYSSVGRAELDSLSILPFALSVFLFINLPIIAVATLRNRIRSMGLRVEKLRVRANPSSDPNDDLNRPINDVLDETEAEIQRLAKSTYRTLVPPGLAFILAVVITATHTLYVRSVVNWTNRAFEIVAPHLSSNDLLRLRSDFRLVRTAADFLKLDAQLHHIAKTNGKQLPEFDPVGKRSRNP